MSAERNGHAKRVRDFFRRNPDEVLTTDDIKTKFDLDDLQLRGLLVYLCKRGEVEVETVRIVKPVPTIETP
ncbi:MAG: hypothetical protein KAX77_00380 [Xanthomonadales bacterium]|nr:hypothetical protein [Xanthomonadales bacterium]